jgi:hypothetical protein
VNNEVLCVMQVSMALIHDAVQLFAHALRRLDSRAVNIRPLDCESQDSWGHGASLINFMKDVTIITIITPCVFTKVQTKLVDVAVTLYVSVWEVLDSNLVQKTGCPDLTF